MEKKELIQLINKNEVNVLKIKNSLKNAKKMALKCSLIGMGIFLYAILYNYLVSSSMFFEFFIIFGLVFFIVSFVKLLKYVIFSNTFYNNEFRKKSNAIYKYFSSSKIENYEFCDDDFILKNNFDVSDTFNFSTLGSKKCSYISRLVIDRKNEKFFFQLGNKFYSKIFSFSDIIDAVINENNTKVISNSAYGSNTSNYCSYLALGISVDSNVISFPIVYICNENVLVSGKRFVEMRNNINEAKSLFLSLKSIAKVKVQETAKEENENQPKDDKLELSKLKEDLEKQKLKFEIDKYKNAKTIYCSYCGMKNSSLDSKCKNCNSILTDE